MTTYLLRLEAVNLDHFVYDTQDVSTIRGGGLTLLDTPQWVQAQFPLQPVTLGASSGIFRTDCTDDEAADDLRQQIEEFLARTRQPFQDVNGEQEAIHLGLATFVVDVVEASGDFGRDRQRLLAKNRWRQMRTPSLAVPQAVPDTPGPCAADRLRPAVLQDQAPPKGTVSESVYQRWQFGRAMRQKFYKEWTDLEFERGFSEDLEKLTKDPSRGNLHGKMAVVYLDGNGFGALQDELCTTTQLQSRFDEILRENRKAVLRDLLRRARDEKDRNGAHPWHEPGGQIRFETLLWGGDEILWVAPAWRGLETVRRFFDAASKWTLDLGSQVTPEPRPLTHACGLVLCHHNAPIAQIRHLAEKLADIAKEASRSDNLVAYQVLESFDHVAGDLEDFRRARCPEGVETDKLLLDPAGLGRALDLAPDLLPQLPHGKVVEIAQRLLDPAREPGQDTADAKDDGVTELGRTAKELEARLCAGLEASAKATLDQLLGSLGGDPVGWLHLAELWDYLSPAPAAKEETT